MKRENRKEKTTFKYVPINGFGVVSTLKGIQDVFVYGYFIMWEKWSFIVHMDVLEPQYVAVSEASTGNLLKDEIYDSVEEALRLTVPFIEERRYLLATVIGDSLVSQGRNLSYANTANIRTLAISTLWM